MNFNRKNVIKYLDDKHFESLFIEELGWDYPQNNQALNITIDEQIFTLTAIAHKRNFTVYQCILENQSIPLSSILKKIDQEITKYAYEHFIIYASKLDQTQKWQWVKKEANKPLANRTVEYSQQKKENLLLILEAIAISLQEESNLTLLDVTAKTKKAFDVDKITKKFYDKFKKEHTQFLSFIQGIDLDFDQQWYASLMLNRLMFVYFIQKKGFLNNDKDYLKNKLNEIKSNPPQTPLIKEGVREEKAPLNKPENSEKAPLSKPENTENPPLSKGGRGDQIPSLNKGGRGDQIPNFYSFYRYFLLKLFHDGLGNQNRTPELDKLLGKIPYLNGGLFEIHPLENKYPAIEIKDEAFEKIFTFFDQYNWHLDDRPLKSDNEINPDVLGYIFEKYINQKQMGAYYTKEDITEYISKNCIIPYLFDTVLTEENPPSPPLRKGGVRAENTEKAPLIKGGWGDQIPSNKGSWGDQIFHLLQENPDRYIYEAVKKGVDLPLPDHIAEGINDISKRNNWNTPADENYALPTEIWREFIARRNRYFEIKQKLINGEITSINDLITYNLDIRQFAQDAINAITSPLTLKIFYDKLSTMSILDPTCGSGAFLFAALNILEPLYEGCLDKMQELVENPPQPPLLKGGVRDEKAPLSNSANSEKAPLSKGGWGDEIPSLNKGGWGNQNPCLTKGEVKKIMTEFEGVLANVRSHVNRKYFILKNIILNNLYGVDIMEEATEVCKLRLFLKLASLVEAPLNKGGWGGSSLSNKGSWGSNYGIEPLPDIDFNIRSGNSLVGFANYQEVEKAVNGDRQIKVDLFDDMAIINDKAKAVSEVYQTFRSIQTQTDGVNFKDTKQKLQENLASLNVQLNNYLAREYGIDINKKKDYQNWLTSHKPFHWFTEFYSIINNGGFDVIIGNPPYVEYSKIKKDYEIKGYETEKCGNLYVFTLELCYELVSKQGFLGFIIPMPSINTARMESLQNLIKFDLKRSLWLSTYDERPSGLFDGVDQRLAIEIFGNKNYKSYIFSTGIQRWTSIARNHLFETINYCKQSEKIKKYTASILKIKNDLIEEEIFKKFYKNSPITQFKISNKTQHLIHYRTAGGRYWKIVLNQPFSTETASEKFTYLTNITSHQAVALISSSTFWWYYSSHFDMFNFKDYMIFGFRFNNASKTHLNLLDKLGYEYLRSLENNSIVKEINSKTKGKVIQKIYVVSLSKPIIDEIDKILAQHYGFSDEELDFIINYDIKYRMGKELDTD